MATSTLRSAALVAIIGLLILVPHAESAITCGQVFSSVAPCATFFKTGMATPACCSGLKAIKAAAVTTADRRAACNCLKTAAGRIGASGSGAGLASKCGVSVPYGINPTSSTNCNAVP